MPETLIVSQLKFEYESVVFSDLSFEVEPGQHFTIYGHNGSGKSTLLKTIAGLLEPHSGSVQLPECNGYRSQIAMLGHAYGLSEGLSLASHFLLDVSIDKMSLEQIDEIGLFWGFDRSSMQKPALLLSQGQKKRLALALMHAKHAKVWLLDEPYMNLDEVGISILTKSIESHLQQGGIVVMTQHQKDAADSFHGICLN